jgi:hypothetical protein
VLSVLIFGVRVALRARAEARVTAKESAFEPMPVRA